MTLHSTRKPFGTHKGRKDAISKGNSFTFQQVYDLAKTEESTKAQMQAITRGYQVGSVHSKKK
ncbi:unnamed protein product, partial [Porites lobata]